MENRRGFVAAAICSLAYGGFFYWNIRGDAQALEVTLWGVSPLALLLTASMLVAARARRALLMLLLALAVIGALILLNSRFQGYDLVPLFLLLHQMEIALLALLITAIIRVRARFIRAG